MSAKYSMLRVLLCGAGTIILAGCQTDQPGTTVDLAPLSTQIGNLSDANADLHGANAKLEAANTALKAENARLKAMLRSDADAGLAANAKGWLPFERYVWGHQITLLPVTPDKDTTDKWLEASDLYSKGGESAMQGVISDLNTKASTLGTQIGTLEKSVEVLTKERDEAQVAADKALQQAKEATANLVAEVAKAKADEAARIAAETRQWEIRVALWFGAGLLALALALTAAAFFISAAAKKLGEGAVIAFALCLGCFALAHFIGLAWFLPTVGAIYGVAIVGWAAWKIRQGVKDREAAKKAADNAMVAKPIISTLDVAYDTADAEHQAWMDAQIFEALGKQGAQYSAAIHEIKASIALEPTLTTSAPQASTSASSSSVAT